MEKKRILIITYYWPPSSGVGVKRWMFFSNELARQNYQPIVVTPQNPQFNVHDEESVKHIDPSIEVLKLPIWEPFGLMQSLTGGRNKKQVKQGIVLEREKKGRLDNLIIWIRGNLFIPDPRVFWVRPTVKYLKKYLRENPVDIVVTTGPPHSVHLIGRQLQKRLDIRWVADLRDPWSNWDLLDKLKASNWAKRAQRRHERNVIENANLVTATSPRQASDLKELGASKTICINNGFPTQSDDLHENDYPRDVFRISHLGLLNELRNPVEFWGTLNAMIATNQELEKVLQIDLYGIISDSVKEQFKQYPALLRKVNFKGYLQQHQLVDKMKEASVLLAIQNRSHNATRIIPYKLYEYLPMRRPIVQIGAEYGDSNDLIESLEVGYAVSTEDVKGMRTAIESIFENWKNGDLLITKDIGQYSHKALINKMIKAFNEIDIS